MFYLVALSVFSLTSMAIGDDRRDALQAAISEHDATVSKLLTGINDGFLQAIKSAANSENLEEVQKLLDERVLFRDFDELPSSPAMQGIVVKYIESRRTSARDVFEKYQAQLSDLGKRLLLKEAEALQREIAEYVNGERVAIGLKPTEPINPRVDGEPVRARKTTSEVMQELIADLSDALQEISDLPTTAVQNTAHRKLMNDLDRRVQRKRLVFRFPISDVQRSGARGRFDLEFTTPLELQGLSNFTYLPGSRNERMSNQEALRLDSGYVYEISGVGRLGVSSSSNQTGPPNTRRVFSIRPNNSSNYYALFISNPKMRIIRDDSATTAIE